MNGDGQGGNDLIYIPRAQSEIQFDTCANDCGSNVTPDQQWAALDAFIKQDKYLSAHRGEIAERFGEVESLVQQHRSADPAGFRLRRRHSSTTSSSASIC